MRLWIAAVGHKMPGWVGEGFAEYRKRMPRETAIELVEIKPEKRTEGRTPQRILEAERDRLLAALPADCFKVILDERGKGLRTLELAARMKEWLRGGRDVAFVIGGADGLHSDLKAQADLLLSLSSLTLPHGLVRVLLAEQLYRATTVLQNHPYHRE